MFRSSLKGTQGVKALDKELSKAQSHIHDKVGPLAHFLARADEDDFSVNEAKSIFRDSVKLIDNTSATISKMRQKRVLKALNLALQEMADEPEVFLSAALLLFGFGFESKMKDHSESFRIHSIVKNRKGSSPQKEVFWQSHSSVPRRSSCSAPRGIQWSGKGKGRVHHRQ